MADYEALDLSEWCNAGVTVIGNEGDVAVGRQTFRGLPFLIGGDNDEVASNRFIELNGDGLGVKVPIRRGASRVIVAHALLETDLPSGGPWGDQVAEYVFNLSGGREDRVAIRERFEIGTPASIGAISGGSGPISAAATDRKAFLLPRYEGSWGEAGMRLMDARGDQCQWYYLWAWKNPDPDRDIESVEFVPRGPRFIVAAITLGRLDEHPFAREGRRPARIVLTDQEAADKPFDLEVEVDRGDTTFAFPLPAESHDEFLGSPYPGSGQQRNPGSSPSYVEVAAIPSATVTVRQDGQEVGKVNWGEVQDKGSAENPRMRVELIDPGKNWVRVAVVDDDTGKPVPCRVHFRSPDGVPFQPYGHHNHVNSDLGTFHYDVGGDLRLGQITYAYIDGTCQGWLPRGEVVVDISRGFEYEPLRTTTTIEPGQQDLTLRIKRWTDMNRQGWYSGDSHVHFLSPQGGHTEAQGEGLNVVNLLQSQWGSLFTNIEDFTGEPNISRSGDSIVYVGQENRQHFMGHMILWGLKKHVMPWCTDGLGESEIGGTMEITLSDWADQCHAQGGTVIAPHFWGLNREAAALVAMGRLDGIEMTGQRELTHNEYYRILNCGYRMLLLGGTDKMTSEVAVGRSRTYVSVPNDQEFNYDNWRRNVALGRTFLSGGPIIHFSVDGREIGDTVALSGPGSVEVEAWAENIFPIHRLEIVQAGRVVASTEAANGTRRLELKEKLKIDGHTWLAARCGGPDYFGLDERNWTGRGQFAHTSPIYVACGDEWRMFDEATARHMLTVLESDLAYIRDVSAQYRPGEVTHHHGEHDHIGYLARPFLEAKEKMQNRLETGI